MRSERLVFEPLVRAHAPLLFGALSDPQLYTFIPKDPPVDVASLEARFARLEARCSPDRSQHWLNWAASAADGYVGMFEATVEGDRALVAYFVFTEWQRRGFAREGLAAVMNELAERYEVRTFIAEIDTRNEASLRLVRSLGFVLEKTTLDADWFKGASSDEHRFVREILEP